MRTAEYLNTIINTTGFSSPIKMTYAAVAANVSKGFAIVTDCISPKNTTMKAVMIPSLAAEGRT
jgi:hypothetical protein